MDSWSSWSGREDPELPVSVDKWKGGTAGKKPMDEPELVLVKTNLMPWAAVGSSRSDSLSSLNYTTAWGMHQALASSQLF